MDKEPLNSIEMKYVYYLEHVYEVSEDEEIKFIGLFSSKKRVNEAIQKLKDQNGFKDYPIDCFKVSKEIINQYEWKEGFSKWED